MSNGTETKLSDLELKVVIGMLRSDGNLTPALRRVIAHELERLLSENLEKK